MQLNSLPFLFRQVSAFDFELKTCFELNSKNSIHSLCRLTPFRITVFILILVVFRFRFRFCFQFRAMHLRHVHRIVVVHRMRGLLMIIGTTSNLLHIRPILAGGRLAASLLDAPMQRGGRRREIKDNYICVK